MSATKVKTFDPGLDGGFQDECACETESSMNCRLRLKETPQQKPIGFCICLCHVEMHESRIERDQAKDDVRHLVADLFEALTPPKSGCDCDQDGDRPLPCVFHRFEMQMRGAIADRKPTTPKWTGPAVCKTREELAALEADEHESHLGADAGARCGAV